MKKENCKIHIIGAGVSGLIAASVLENHGFKPVILEATDRAGGRIKTDNIKGYQLDHGFQVLLTAYPEAKKHLNFKALELQPFLHGATIFNNGNKKTIGDPLRNITLLIPTLFSGIGSLSDKLKILKLNTLLKKKKISEIFAETEKTTFQYLVDFGFSEAIILHFFKPFFSGIFLENKLETSSRMFEFVYKMFGEGYATLPKAGIEAIPKQLVSNLKYTQLKFNTKVNIVEDDKIILEDNTTLHSHFIVIAAEPGKLIPNYNKQEIVWKSCDTLYFETNTRVIKKPLIGLIANNSSLINNIFYHNSIATQTKGEKELLSVTVIKQHNLSIDALVIEVKKELETYCEITNCTFLKYYKIPKALPHLKNLKNNIQVTETSLSNTIFLAGDTLLNGSLNAAMLSGESAALGIIESFDLIK